jgi:hypothetical protein
MARLSPQGSAGGPGSSDVCRCAVMGMEAQEHATDSVAATTAPRRGSLVIPVTQEIALCRSFADLFH